MEAWIVHIRKESFVDEKSDKIVESNEYSAWATKNQALKAIGELLRIETDRYWDRLFSGRDALLAATKALLEANQIEAIIELINKYTDLEREKKNAFTSMPAKVRILIKQTKFLGSPFK